MEDKKITLRMGPSDVQMMDAYLEEHSEFENVSHLIRTAVKKYIQHGDAKNTSSTGSGLFVRFKPTELETIRTIAEKEDFLDEEEFIRTLVRKTYAPMEKGQYSDAFLTARDVTL
ncbi:MAG: ribbon-helix-helix domain-containing protein [Methanomassiliicoccaceae archaeon]|jgi:Arc/MetJ-type ribon-helix-helix transcriptional regulator|nr:ribbon-helix-helix domain-containing protein [Methanomassiliicoccaceae archaeon]